MSTLIGQGRPVRDAHRATGVSRRSSGTVVVDVMSNLLFPSGNPGHVRSDDRRELVIKAGHEWGALAGADTACIAPGGMWQASRRR